MKSIRLRTSERPDRANDLLESFVWSSHTIPATATRVGLSNELPPALRRLARKGDLIHEVWSAWTEADRTWFILAVPSPALANDRNRPVMQIRVHAESGELTEAATYIDSFNAGWQLCA